MALRTKILVPFALLLAVTVAAVTWRISVHVREAFARLDELHSADMTGQLQREFQMRSESLVQQVTGIANADSTLRLAIEVNRPGADMSLYVNDARDLAAAHRLDFLELVADDGSIISSAQWPARFGYKESWLVQRRDWDSQPAFARQEELPGGSALAIEAVRPVKVGDRKLYIVAGRRLDLDAVKSMGSLTAMDVFLYRAATVTAPSTDLQKVSSGATTTDPSLLIQKLNEFAAQVRDAARTGTWQPDFPDVTSTRNLDHIFSASSYLTAGRGFHVIAFTGFDDQLVGALALVSSRQELERLERRVRNVALAVAGGAVIIALLVSGWTAARVTRPVERLALAAEQVASGNLGAQVDDSAEDEIGRLAYAFNRMTRELLEQRERLLQTERVAAWRELARRLAHELKNPLFPLQITVENLLRARERTPAEFEDVFRESAETLLAEIGNLKTIVARFSDFSKMPTPELQPVNINEIVRRAVKFYEPQFNANGRPAIAKEFCLDSSLEGVAISADPELLHRAISNLLLNALDAMPNGGTLAIRTFRTNGSVRIEVIDNGVGMTAEEKRQLFTPYYTSKQFGTGLGLAIVQSIVSDHKGRIWVESEKGRGTTFIVELPMKAPGD
jgi:two-component system, NtrC family, nitrogen regulation sensor histidine kinase NtrY